MKLHTLFLLGICSVASAHTAVSSVTPGAFATVHAPKSVQLKLNEAVDLHFATLKVYPLNVSGDKLTLNRAAAALAKTALKGGGDDQTRADTFKKQALTTASITVPLKPNLTPGAYVVMWKLLSADGHVISGQSVFTVE